MPFVKSKKFYLYALISSKIPVVSVFRKVMSRIAYVNGRYVPHKDAEVSIDDRGYQFGDGVYEVVTVVNGIWPIRTGTSTGWNFRLVN